MSQESSPVRKAETIFDDAVSLYRRRPKLFYSLCFIGVIAALGYVVVIPLLRHQNKNLQEQINGLVEQINSDKISHNVELSDLKRERDTYAIRLSQFQALADKSFSNAPPDKRLDLLLERVEKLIQLTEATAANLPKRWKLTQTTLDAIDAYLSQPGNNYPTSIVMNMPMGDTRGADLFSQIITLHERHNIKVEPLQSAGFQKGLILQQIELDTNSPIFAVYLAMCRDLSCTPKIETNSPLLRGLSNFRNSDPPKVGFLVGGPE